MDYRPHARPRLDRSDLFRTKDHIDDSPNMFSPQRMAKYIVCGGIDFIMTGPPKIPLSYRSGIRTFWAIFGLNAVRNPDILTQNPGQGRS